MLGKRRLTIFDLGERSLPKGLELAILAKEGKKAKAEKIREGATKESKKNER